MKKFAMFACVVAASVAVAAASAFAPRLSQIGRSAYAACFLPNFPRCEKCGYQATLVDDGGPYCVYCQRYVSAD